jgi:hypothetical protein
MITCRFLICCTLLLSLIGAAPARAEEPPETRVGRISIAEGTVAVRPADGEWADAGLNHPVAAGMSVRTAAQGRAVLRIGSEVIALAAATELDLLQLDRGDTEIALRSGRIGVHLSPHGGARRAKIDIPQGAVRLLAPGDYEIAAGVDAAPSWIAVLDGGARFTGKGLDTAIAVGSTTELSGSDPVAAAIVDAEAAASTDTFVGWWREAAGGEVEPRSLRYVSAEMTGYEALDAHGSWESVDELGAVWFPSALPADWSPFRHGHWRWVGPWGWTWIDDMAWGFAPAHYGRWARLAGEPPADERWGWVPGKRSAPPAYMPAAVAFLGTAGVGLSYPDAFRPGVAWFPLAPGEIYWPSYTQDIDAIRHLNAGAVADLSTIGPAVKHDPPADIVNAEYRKRRFATVVPRSVFIGGSPVAPAAVDVPEQRLENAPVLAGSPQITPPAARVVQGSDASAPGSVPPELAKAKDTLDRIVKPHGAKPAIRNAVHTRSVSAPAQKTQPKRAQPRAQPKQAQPQRAQPRRTQAKAQPKAAQASSARPARSRAVAATPSGAGKKGQPAAARRK